MNYRNVILPVGCVLGASLLAVNAAWAQKDQAEVVSNQSPVVHVAPTATPALVADVVVPSLPKVTVSPRPTPRTSPAATPSPVVVAVSVVSPQEEAAPVQEQARVDTPVAEQANEQAGEKRPSGIKGTMFIGPTCPAVQISVDGTVTNNDCGPDRYDGTASIYDAETNELVTEVTASNGGNFKLDLEPGMYYAASPEGRLNMTWLPMTDIFTVNESGYTEVTFMFDNGLR
jgi:hypothetical protein